MALIANFPAGVTDITVHGLHQWDYGRTLDIKAPDLPAVVEVHFAHRGMTEAVVRVCSTPNGVASAAIPDICLEQTQPIKAWVYYVGDTSGRTVLTVTLPVIARTRPAPTESIPTEIADRYTQLISEVGELVDSMATGDITIQHAVQADTATTANSANSAGTALADANGVPFDSGYLKAPGDAYAVADQGGLNVFYLPVVGRTVSLRAKVGNFWVDMGVVHFPGSDVTVYLAPLLQERSVGDGSVFVPCLAVPEATVSTTPGYYAGGQVLIRLMALTDTESSLSPNASVLMRPANLYYKVLA